MFYRYIWAIPPLWTLHIPCVQIRSRLPGTVWRGLIFFMTDRPHYILKCPHFPGTEWFWLCVRSQCHQISHMRTFDENSCAISITSPRSLSSPRTQHVWWDHREKSRRASTLWDCRGKSPQTGPNVNAGLEGNFFIQTSLHWSIIVF